MEIDAVLYPRADISAFGLAPMTSMFYFDVYDRNGIDDFRTRVHDSSGLQMVSGRNERIWRPLNNPTNLQISAFLDENPKGFGLVQRKRAFRDFQDADARYDRRPSLWVEPVGTWGRGTIDLVEIPVNSEFNDNIVAYWHPAEPLKAGSERRFSYRLHWCDQPPDTVALGRVAETRSGITPNAGPRLFVIDFEKVEAAPADIDVELSASAGKVTAHPLQRLPDTGLLRLIFDFVPDGTTQSEFRAVLRQKGGGDPVSETWLYRWTV
jgi:glucans biosynthesis protein